MKLPHKKDILLYLFFIALAGLFWFIQGGNQSHEVERVIHLDTITTHHVVLGE